MAWEIFSIGNIGKIVTGKTPKSGNPEEFGNLYPFITPSDMSFGIKHIDVERGLSEKGKEEHSKIVLPKKSTCVVCIGATIGKTCITKTESFSNQQINSIIPNTEKHDPDFIYYFSTLLRPTLESFAGGAATPIINKSAFSSIKASLPDLKNQKKIAAILSAYDDLIENNKRRIAILENMAEEIYREWFVRFRFPGYQTAEFEKGIPKEWKLERIDSLGGVVTGKTPSTSNSKFYDGEIHFVKTPDMHGNMFIYTTEEMLTEEGLASQPSQIIPENSICVSCIGTGGVVSITTQKCSTNQQINSLALKNAEDLEWAFFMLKSLKPTILAFGATGATMTNLSKGKFAGIKALIAPKELRKSFHQVANPLFNQIQALTKVNFNLIVTRDSLLSRLISGKLSVEDLEIQFPPSMQENSAA